MRVDADLSHQRADAAHAVAAVGQHRAQIERQAPAALALGVVMVADALIGRGVQDLLEQRRLARQLVQDVGDEGERVVDLVRDAGGELPEGGQLLLDRQHALRAAQLLVEPQQRGLCLRELAVASREAIALLLELLVRQLQLGVLRDHVAIELTALAGVAQQQQQPAVRQLRDEGAQIARATIRPHDVRLLAIARLDERVPAELLDTDETLRSDGVDRHAYDELALDAQQVTGSVVERAHRQILAVDDDQRLGEGLQREDVGRPQVARRDNALDAMQGHGAAPGTTSIAPAR